jgi:thioesterase domain-containing protein/acyl carrier protein
MASIFSQVLRTPSCSAEADFFDLGGNSLLAVTLMERIEREFGVRLPLAQLLTDSTVARLARQLTPGSRAAQAWKSLVAIRAREGKPALYLVHGAGGNILLYRELADALGDEASVYGFQSRGLDGRAEPMRTIEAMAAGYLEELRAHQPRGPYRLGGYCMGGMVAYEMGRLLVEAGAEVEFVALLDTYNLSTAEPVRGVRRRLSRAWQWGGFQLGNVTSLRGQNLRAYVGEKWRRLREAAANVRAGKHTVEVVAGQGGGRAENSHGQRIQQLNDEAALSYKPLPCSVRMFVFKPRNNYAHLSDPAMGWRHVAGGKLELIEICENPHAMLIQPAVQKLAAALRERMRQ